MGWVKGGTPVDQTWFLWGSDFDTYTAQVGCVLFHVDANGNPILSAYFDTHTQTPSTCRPAGDVSSPFFLKCEGSVHVAADEEE